MDLDVPTQETIREVVSLASISSLASAAWEIMTAEHLTWRGFFRGLILAFFVALLCFEGMKSLKIDDGFKFVITGICAFCADYLLKAIINIVLAISKKPVDFLIKIISR